MREIKAFIRRNLTEEVVAALQNGGFISISIIEVEGTGKLTPINDVSITNLPVSYNKMTKLEIVCKEDDVKNIIEIIHKYGGTGEKGDGIIYVAEVLQVFMIRTGKENMNEIQ